MITGRSGDGKSTILKRLAYEIAKKIGDHVLFAKSRAELDPEQLILLQKSCEKPLVLFIDNMSDRLQKVNQLISSFRSAKVEILIIGASRKSDWFSVLNNFFTKPIEFPIEKLSDEEIHGIIEKLKINDSLFALTDKTPEQRFEIFNQKSDRELIVAMCEATSGLSLAEIIANEYTSLKSQLAKKAYLHVCLIHQFRYRIPQSLFLRVLQLDLMTVKQEVFNFTQDVIYTDEADGTDYLLRSRHAVIASVVSKYYFKDEVSKVEFLTSIFRDHVPSNPLEASLIKMLYHHTTIKEMFESTETGVSCYEELEIHVPDNAYLLQQKALFIAYHTNDYTAAKTTIKNAIRLNESSSVLHHTHGTILMREALEERDNDKSIYYLEEGKRILEQGVRRNANNVYNYHTLISTLIKWYKKKGETKDDLILEIQELVHEASQLHPNDSMILTEHGKLHTILHNLKKSKEYFKKAIRLNPGSISARYLLAKIFVDEGKDEEALEICNEAVKVKPEEVQINRLRFELIHKLNRFTTEEIIREYEDYLHVNKKDSFLKLCYASYLYCVKSNKCDRIFTELRNSEIMSFTDKLNVSKELYQIINQNLIEHGSIIGVQPNNYFIQTNRFNCRTRCFLAKGRIRGLRKGNTVKYHVRFNYLGPVAESPEIT